MLKKIGIGFLAALIFLLSTGIHDLVGHTPRNAAAHGSGYDELLPRPDNLGNEDRDHCSACLFVQLLNHCLIPAADQPFLAESFRLQLRGGPETETSTAARHKTTRAPPSSAV